MVEIGQLTEEHLGFAAHQTDREGWWSGRVDFELYLEHDPEGSFVACGGGRPIGLVTTIRYDSGGWIGNLIVVPEHRRRGVGRALIERGLAHLEAAGIGTIRLEGDPPGIPLYRSLGFIDEWESLRFRASAGRVPKATDPTDPSIRVVTTDRLAGGGPGGNRLTGIAALDRDVLGDDRGRLIGLLAGRAERLLTTTRGDDLTGYLMLARTDRGLRIGPGVAVDAPAAEALLKAAATAFPAEPLSVGVPAPNAQTSSILARLGFESTPPSLRMVRGKCAAAGRPEQVIAIANGALG